MKLSTKIKKQIASYVIDHYFCNARIERIVLEFLIESAMINEVVTTKQIVEYLEKKKELATSDGAIRGTILRIRHKLLKYREETADHPNHLVFPEPQRRRGYLLQFEKNPNYHVSRNQSFDPWLMKNWELLREGNYRGLWKGLSLPDGGRWPLKLYVCVHSIRDEETQREKFMFLINSPSKKKPRMGILEGEVENSILHMQGHWSTRYENKGIIDFSMKSQMWPFRRSEDEAICFSGRFFLYTQDNSLYQEGQVELKYCPLSNLSEEDITYLSE